MSRSLYDVSDPRLFESGIYAAEGVDVLKAPLFVDGDNINFREASVQKMKGWTDLYTYGSTINCVAQAFVAGQKRAYVGLNGELHKFENAVNTSLETGLSNGFWSMAPWGSWLLAVNGVDAFRVWKNAGAPVVPTTGFTTAEIARVLKYHVVCFNTSGAGSNGPDRIAWSSADNPELWTPAAGNSAGGINVRNIASPIQAAELLGDSIAFYSLDQMYLLNYIGGQLVFGYDEALSGIGAIGKNCVTMVGRRHFGFEKRGFWETDGVQEDFIDEPPVKDYLQGRLDISKPNEIVAFHNRKRRLVEWYYPKIGGGYEGIGYNYEAKHWAPRDIRFSAVQAGKVFDGPLAGADTKLVQLETGVNAGASALAASIKTKPLDFGDKNVWKYIDEIRLRMTKVGNLTMKVGLQEYPEGPIEWLTMEAQEQNFIEREAVFLTLQFESTAIGDDWNVSGFEFFGEVGGFRV